MFQKHRFSENEWFKKIQVVQLCSTVEINKKPDRAAHTAAKAEQNSDVGFTSLLGNGSINLHNVPFAC